MTRVARARIWANATLKSNEEQMCPGSRYLDRTAARSVHNALRVVSHILFHTFTCVSDSAQNSAHTGRVHR